MGLAIIKLHDLSIEPIRTRNQFNLPLCRRTLHFVLQVYIHGNTH